MYKAGQEGESSPGVPSVTASLTCVSNLGTGLKHMKTRSGKVRSRLSTLSRFAGQSADQVAVCLDGFSNFYPIPEYLSPEYFNMGSHWWATFFPRRKLTANFLSRGVSAGGLSQMIQWEIRTFRSTFRHEHDATQGCWESFSWRNLKSPYIILLISVPATNLWDLWVSSRSQTPRAKKVLARCSEWSLKFVLLWAERRKVRPNPILGEKKNPKLQIGLEESDCSPEESSVRSRIEIHFIHIRQGGRYKVQKQCVAAPFHRICDYCRSSGLVLDSSSEISVSLKSFLFSVQNCGGDPILHKKN